MHVPSTAQHHLANDAAWKCDAILLPGGVLNGNLILRAERDDATLLAAGLQGCLRLCCLMIYRVGLLDWDWLVLLGLRGAPVNAAWLVWLVSTACLVCTP